MGLALLAPGVHAQVPEGGWIVGSQASYVTYHSQYFPVAATTQATFQGGWDGLAVDHNGIIYTLESVGLNRVLYNGTLGNSALVPETPGSPYPGSWGGGHMAVTRDGVWVTNPDGRLFHIDLAVNNLPFATIRNVLTGSSTSGSVVSACSDGRLLFLSVLNPANASEVWSLDLRAPMVPIRHVATIPSPLAYQVCLVLQRDGNLLAMGSDALYAIDVHSGQVSVVEARPPSPLFGGSPTRVAYDPWTDTVAVSPGYLFQQTIIYKRQLLGSGPFVYAWGTAFGYALRKIVSASEQPFELFGTGCLNVLGREPRIGWQGLPLQGQTFILKLRDAEPNGFAAFWVGTSDTAWPGLGPLPMETSSFGAPGCHLFASSEFSLFAFVDSVGDASLPVPVPMNSALHGLEVYAQTVSTSGANALGFAASDAVAIRIR